MSTKLFAVLLTADSKLPIVHFSFYHREESRALQMNFFSPQKNFKLKPAIFSFFAGAGFLDLGFESSGFEVVFVNEIHKAFLEAYRYSRSKLGIAKPMFGYLESDIDNFLNSEEGYCLKQYVDRAKKSHGLVGFIGGPPCPDFSVAGKNKGKDGENGKLSKSYVDIICANQPDFFVFENVKGLWRTSRHRAFYEELKTQLRANGYNLTDRLVNSIEYGAPQDRDRIILVGFRKSSFANCSDIESEFPWGTSMKYSRSILKENFWPKRDNFRVGVASTCPSNIPQELTVQHWFDKNAVKEHPNSNDQFVPRAALAKFQIFDEGDDSKKCFKRLHRWRYSPTAAYGNNEVHLHPFEARRISVAEALAVQSLPRKFSLPPNMSLTDKFKTIGNGVPFELGRGVAHSLKQSLEALVWQN